MAKLIDVEAKWREIKAESKERLTDYSFSKSVDSYDSLTSLTMEANSVLRSMKDERIDSNSRRSDLVRSGFRNGPFARDFTKKQTGKPNQDLIDLIISTRKILDR